MSRLIIKNIPSYVTVDRLKDHFAQKGGPGGTLTDVKVALKPDGTSRRFGFVGFKTEQEAQQAQKWFDRTYIDTTRISVNFVEKGTKEAPTPRPNKRPRLGPAPDDDSTRSILSAKPGKDLTAPQDGAGPPKGNSKSNKVDQLDEFIQVMQPRTKKGRSWANEDIAKSPPLQASTSQHAHDTDAKVNAVDDDPKDVVMEEDQVDGEMDDMEWMKRRMKKALEISEGTADKVFEQDDDGVKVSKEVIDIGSEKEPERSFEPKDPTRETILQTSRLFLRNLAFSCTESEIQDLFSPFGEIAQVHIALDSVTKSSKGLAFVKFQKPECALAAYEALDKVSFQGRLLHILPAVDRKSKETADGDDGKPITVRGEKEKKRKETASKEFNWSMLYMNSDAVASSIADRMNISKSDILNPESTDGDNTSAAVKLALAETHIIQETKTYLESEGINIASFASLHSPSSSVRQRRSDTCILVKNIPYGTTEEQIRELFEPHGELSRVLVPPAGTMAVVEFMHSDDATKAFRAVSYRRMGSSIVYLEKAPTGIFEPTPGSRKSGPKTARPSKAPGGTTKPIPTTDQDADDDESEETPTLATGSTLFVKNLSFATTEERLTNVFKHLPAFSFARVQTKPDSRAPPGIAAPRLSMGYGFVGFKTPDAAKKAMLSMQGFVLDGHALQVKFAGRGVEEEESKGKDKSSGARTTKMIVKNVPFEASKKEIRELFGAHGQLKSVRLPKKFDTRSRGFAFLDFVTRHEAENAYAALRHTHLLGRHLVLEWAEDTGHDVELLRQKAGVGHGGGAELPGRKRKLEMGNDDDDPMNADM